MANFNRIILFCRLTRDPELSYLPSQTPVVEFSVATSCKFKGNDGQMKEDVMYIDCRMYGKRAEVIQKYVKKGDPLLVEGRLRFDQWKAQDGSSRSKHRVFVENFEFGGGKSSESDQGHRGQSETQQTHEASGGDYPNGTDDDSGIPF